MTFKRALTTRNWTSPQLPRLWLPGYCRLLSHPSEANPNGVTPNGAGLLVVASGIYVRY